MAQDGPNADYITTRLERLHEEGVVNIDAPLRDAIPELSRRVAHLRALESPSDRWWLIVNNEPPYFLFRIDW
jgi:hypothetical protein